MACKRVRMVDAHDKSVDFDKMINVTVFIDERPGYNLISVLCDGCVFEEKGYGQIQEKTKNTNPDGTQWKDYVINSKIYRHIAVYDDMIYLYFIASQDFVMLSEIFTKEME